MSEQEEREAIEKIAEAARSFLKTYDEFWPEYPAAVGEYLDALFTAIEGYDDGVASVSTLPQIWPPPSDGTACLFIWK